MELIIHPLTPDRWNDFEAIFNARGCSVARNCGCMYYRHSGTETATAPGITRAQKIMPN